MIDNSKEYILCAAIWYDDGKPDIFRGATYQNKNIKSGFVAAQWRHGNVISLYPTNPKVNGGMKSVQGFLTSKGYFVDRRQAAVIAYRCGQISKEKYTNDLYDGESWSDDQFDAFLTETPRERVGEGHKYPMQWLFSEDLY